MLALVAAADDYEQAWMKVRRAYSQIAENIQTGRTSLEQAWPELDFMFTSQLFLSDPESTLKTIARETAHFKASAKRNEKSAQWQREKRAGRKPYTPEEVKHKSPPISYATGSIPTFKRYSTVCSGQTTYRNRFTPQTHQHRRRTAERRYRACV